VHYEKQPLFCANCKILGHNLQNCMKLNNTNNYDGPAKLKSNVDMNGKKHMVQVLSGKKLREGDFIDHVKTADKALNNEPSLDAPSQQNVEQVHLTLHNPFELLDNGSELVTDEAETADMEPTPTRLDMQTVQNPCVEDNSLGKDSMTQNTNTEDTGIFAKRPSEPMILTSCKPLLGSANGRLSFPISGPASLVSPVLQPVLTPITTTDEPVKKGNLVSPDVSKEKVGLNQTAPSEVPCNLVNRPSQSAAFSPIKMATPITIYEELGPDKGKIHVIGGSKNVTAAAKKSVQILSKLWGDVVDSDHTTDGTLDPDSDSEKMNMHPVALQFLEAQSDALHQPKSGRKSRKSSSSASSERIQTRSKKGVIKSNPKYVS
jgi:hypothetical protein